MDSVEILQAFIDELPVLDRWNNKELSDYLVDVEKALLAIFMEETDFGKEIFAIRENLPSDPDEKVQERWDHTIENVQATLSTAIDHIKLIEATIPKQLPGAI